MERSIVTGPLEAPAAPPFATVPAAPPFARVPAAPPFATVPAAPPFASVPAVPLPAVPPLAVCPALPAEPLATGAASSLLQAKTAEESESPRAAKKGRQRLRITVS